MGNMAGILSIEWLTFYTSNKHKANYASNYFFF